MCQDGSLRDGRLGAIRKGVVSDPGGADTIIVSCIVLAFQDGAQAPTSEFQCARWVLLGK